MLRRTEPVVLLVPRFTRRVQSKRAAASTSWTRRFARGCGAATGSSRSASRAIADTRIARRRVARRRVARRSGRASATSSEPGGTPRSPRSPARVSRAREGSDFPACRGPATLPTDTTTDLVPTAPMAGALRCMVCGRESAWLLPPPWRIRRVSAETRAMITPEQHAEIRRLHYGEHWKVGTIAAALGVHHDTVRAAIANDAGRAAGTAGDPARPVSALHPRHARAVSAAARHAPLRDGQGPRLPRLGRATAALGAPDSPGGDDVGLSPAHHAGSGGGQVDWGSFGSIRIGRGVRPLSGFVMVLSYSRAIFALFTVDQTLEFPARSRRSLCGVSGRRAHPGLRQSAERGAGTRGHRDSLSSAPAGARRPLSLRAPALYAGPRE